ncbi:hypothetical protein PYW07_001777 [Mythimna separata]|uniref:Uncharacterized protein n=1 Tax=Mythimna separata TaxID=271217 RepID=A0AAD7YUJ1_MYTSE|nr:hypothetical protein PYW07_001777 [Mythimna separata]
MFRTQSFLEEPTPPPAHPPAPNIPVIPDMLNFAPRVLSYCSMDHPISWITMETAGLPLPGYHYIAPNHIVKAPIH